MKNDASRRALFRFVIRLGAVLGASGVMLGAFGAHALRAHLSSEMLEIYKTGVLYHLLHAVAVLASASAMSRLRWPHVTVALFTVGVTIFSGSLYILAMSGVRLWGAVTPLGGVSLIAGWLSLTMLRPSSQDRPQTKSDSDQDSRE